MVILFLKSKPADSDEQIPLREKMLLYFRDRVERATTDKDRERAERELREYERAGES